MLKVCIRPMSFSGVLLRRSLSPEREEERKKMVKSRSLLSLLFGCTYIQEWMKMT